MKKQEYGGYLPLEGRTGPDHFSALGEDNVFRTNSAKAAIYFALKQLSVRKLYLPYYMCLSVNTMADSFRIPVERYYLDNRLMPVLSFPEEGRTEDCILLVNYFGVLSDDTMEMLVNRALLRFKTVIVDNSHAFFAKPLIKEGVYNVYSCRKFFGVPDGGYLIAGGLSAWKEEADRSGEWEPDLVSRHFSYLTGSMEYGMNALYGEKQESDRYFKGHYRGMSVLTRQILSGVDYTYIRSRRSDNFSYLHSLLSEKNLISMTLPEEKRPGAGLKTRRQEINSPSEPLSGETAAENGARAREQEGGQMPLSLQQGQPCTGSGCFPGSGEKKISVTLNEGFPSAYLYPFYAEKNIKSRLIEQKIYVPTLWRELICGRFLGTREYDMS
ncbi:MAG: hypothetical protein IKN57_12865, partial [Parasporobacterium sp.]|nr:hypothetical protein [Parasporobacterium sp.]